MRYESSATGFLSTTALAKTVPALLVIPILPPSQASLLLGSVQPATPAGSIDAHFGSVYVSLRKLRPSSVLVRYGSLLSTTTCPLSSAIWPPNIQMPLRSIVSPSPERLAVMPQPQNSLSGLEIFIAASRSLPRSPSSVYGSMPASLKALWRTQKPPARMKWGTAHHLPSRLCSRVLAGFSFPWNFS